MRKLVLTILCCLVLCCCNRHSLTKPTTPIKDSTSFTSDRPWLDTLDINIALILGNMGIYDDYRKYGIKGFVMPRDTTFRNTHRSDIYPEDATDVEWAVYHVKRFIYTDSMFRLMRKDSSATLRLKVRTSEQHPDTVVNHVQITFEP